ncbi:hypothetical protein [Cellulomonas sp. NPDC089187]|uniref:hypothetical protein n=1 Tax=Cellulomonas sp. NPDC089187 TaxID=3154970 RepID=UPI00341D6EF6
MNARRVGRDLAQGLIEVALGLSLVVLVIGGGILGLRWVTGVIGFLLGLAAGTALAVLLAVVVTVGVLRRRRR